MLSSFYKVVQNYDERRKGLAGKDATKRRRRRERRSTRRKGKGVVVVASAFLIGLNHSQESTFTIIHSHHAKGYPSLVLWNFSFLPHKLQQADQP
jgi:hypothetical protein